MRTSPPRSWTDRLERQRIEQLEDKATVPTAKSLTYAAMDVSSAVKTYAEERRAQVSKRMAAYWLENLHPLEEFFKDAKLRQITPAQIAAYQNARTGAARAPKTINGEISVLRQVLKRAKLWYRFADEYKAIRNVKPAVGRALTTDQQRQLFAVAQTRPAWLYAYVASSLAFYCGLRACRDQRASLAGRRLVRPLAARTSIEDASGLALTDAEPDLRERAS